MSVLPVGFGSNGGVDVGDIGHSLRCRSAGNPSLNRTFGTPTSNTSWILHCGIKLGTLTTLRHLLGVGVGSMAGHISLSAGNALTFTDNAGNVVATSTPLERDPTGHGFLTVRSNGTNIKGYWNATEILSYTGTITTLNSAGAHWIGRRSTANADHFDGYLSRFCFVDNGGSLTPQDFITFNTEINEWVSKSQSAVKAVVDAGGTNSFMLDFDDATSLTTLGYDKSSKGNNWTLNNFSLTAGTTYDHMLDVPGNSYATLNNIYPSAANITNGNLTSGTTAVRATMNALALDSKWEVTAGGSAVTAGVISGTGTTNTTSVTANKVFAFRLTTAGALDYKNVTDAGSWTSITTGLTGEQYPYGITQAANWNFGQAPLHASATYQAAAGGYFYDTTAGFKALCQANLPDVAIKNPKLHFDVVTYAGNSASTRTFTGLQFQPDKIDTKSRSSAYDWMLFDSVRGAGATKDLQSCTTNAEGTNGANYGYVSAFNSDGYTITNGSLAADLMNETGYNYVANCWKAGGAAVSNTAGSITSQVSANVDAGFSVVTYTGTGANATVGHGLTKVPKLVIVKQRTSGTVENWAVSHTGIANTEYLLLNTTAAKTAGATYWNSTTPTTSVFSVGSAADTNESAKDFVAYCFADIEGYSKAFSYTGNASTDGVYVDLGFKPSWILLKCSSTTGNWVVFDTTRNTYNVMGEQLYPNLANAGSTVTTLDVTSRGFKARIATDPNSAQTFIGFAIADVAGKYSLGR